MLEQLRTAIQMASSVAEVPKQQAERFAKGLVKRGDLRNNQVSKVAEDIVRRSQENAQMVQALVGSEIKRQIKALGLATRDDVERLGRRVFGLATREEVERLAKRVAQLEKKPSGPKPAAKKPATRASKPKTN